MRLPVCPDFSIRVVKTEDLSVRSNALISLTLQFIEEPPGFLSLKNMLTLHGSKNQQPLVGGIHQKTIRHVSNRLNLQPKVMNQAVEIPCTGKKKPQVVRYFCCRADSRARASLGGFLINCNRRRQSADFIHFRPGKAL